MVNQYGYYTPYTVKPRKRMSAAAKALIAALVALAITITGSMMVLTVYSISEMVDSTMEPWNEGEQANGVPLSPDDHGWKTPQPNPNAPQLMLHAPGTEAEKLSDTEAAAKVRQSVVGIVAYVTHDGKRTPVSEGSGVVMTKDGYILTNAHVLQGGQGFLVIDHRGNYYNAVSVGSDPRTDLAVLRIVDYADLVPAEFGNSEAVAVGDSVLAIGNPGGLMYASSVTFGHVSAVDRVIDTSVNVFGLLQVDAPINPGNSGGALVNQWGQVIGINCAKVIGEGYEGIGFAIPITKAKMVFDTLLKYGYLKDQVRLGVSIQAVDTITAAFEGTRTGIRIIGMERNNVFARTGVQAQDIIIAINGKRITNSGAFFEAMYACKPQDKAEFTLYRPANKEIFTVTVALQGKYQ